MFSSIKGVIEFEAIAPDTNKFINDLKNSGIILIDVYCKNEKIIGHIYHSDFKILQDIAAGSNSQIAILQKKGKIFTAMKYKKRIGIFLGAILSFLMILYLSDIVMIIEIYGNEKISDKQVLSLLNDCGISIGTYLPEVDLRTSEKRIVSLSNDISWIGIRSSGSKLQVEIREMDLSPKIAAQNTPCNIVASKDAQIVDIKNVYTGMLVQMLNSGVKKGDLLISGTFEDGKGGVYYTHSRGEIIGRYTDRVVFSQPYSDEKIFYDDKICKKSLHFFGLRIPLSPNPSQMFQYEYDEEISYLTLGNIQFPVGTICSEYKPYTTEYVTYSPEQAQDILTDKINLYEYNFYQNEDVKVIDKEAEFIEKEDKLYVVVKYTLEGNIGIQKEIMVKK